MSRRPPHVPSFALVFALFASACGDYTYPSDPPEVIGGERPARVYAPDDYDPSRAYPLVVLLHGYAANGTIQDLYFGTSGLVTEEQYVLVVPEGTPDALGNQYWNATAACCANAATDPPDDVAYLRALVAEASTSYHVDARRIFTFGHSNGGFMSFRLACEAPDVFAGIGTLAGATLADAEDCTPGTPPVSVLALHGTADETIRYEGSDTDTSLLGSYPSAHETLMRHAALAGCDTNALETGAPLDLLMSSPDTETSVERYGAGCAAGTGYELWTIAGGSHIPGVGRETTRLVLRWLFAHGR